jgi:hypothetical protein
VETAVCQRWRSGRCSWRPAGELFDAKAYEVAAITDDTTARRFVVEHHYSKTFPAARRRFGLYGPGGSLDGVAVYSVPAREAVLSPIPGGMAEALELGRFVLLDRVPANAESWFLARTFELLRKEGFAGAVSFSDPHPRATTDGRTVFAGHIGTIYQAVNAVFLGRAKRHQLLLLPDGRSFNRRALSKIRRRERGWHYAVEQLVAAGAPEPGASNLDRWLVEALAAVVRRVEHPGCLKYALAFGRSCRRALPRSLPYLRLAPTPCPEVLACCA